MPPNDEGRTGRIRRLLRPVLNVWLALVRGFSWVTVRLLAIVLFPTVFLAYSIVMRIVGFDPLKRSFDDDQSSYLTDAELTNEGLPDFKRQY